MRAAVNYTAGKYACFCLKIHQECSEECVTAVVVVFAETQGIAPPNKHYHLPLSNQSPLVFRSDSSSFVPFRGIRRNRWISSQVMLYFSGAHNWNLVALNTNVSTLIIFSSYQLVQPWFDRRVTENLARHFFYYCYLLFQFFVKGFFFNFCLRHTWFI